MTETNHNQDSKLGVYELAVLIDPKLSEDNAVNKLQNLGDTVVQESGAVISSGDISLRDLAYEITIKNEGKRRDFTRAYFGWVKFEQDPAELAAIKNILDGDTDLVRYMIIKTTREDFVTSLTDELDPSTADNVDTEGDFADDEDEDDSDDTDSESDENDS